MTISFTKYQATGNDFILIDNRDGKLALSKEQIIKICDRKFGIGADGLILIESSNKAPFHVNYYNSDGSQSLCGNGSRAAVHFAAKLGLVGSTTQFDAYDGLHEATLLSNNIVRLKMNDVQVIETKANHLFLNTGSPHVVEFVNHINQHPVLETGKTIRYSETFKPGGTNVNFVEALPNNTIFVRTYERGVENETLSCGTGVTAAALAATTKGYISPVRIETKGGQLTVEFVNHGDGKGYKEIYLIGPAMRVFEGEISLQ